MKVKNSKRPLCLLFALTIISCVFTVTNASGKEVAQILEATENGSLSEEQVVSEEGITSVEQEMTESNGASEYADTNNISGVVWLDNSTAMGDGIYDSVEQNIADYTVSLYRSADTSTAIQTTTTDASGAYEFSGLEPDIYIVGITSETISGTEYLLPLVGITSDNKFAMDESTWSNAFTDPITLNTNTVVTDINAGVRSTPTPQTMIGHYDVTGDMVGTYTTLKAACDTINSDGGTTYIITTTTDDPSMGALATIQAGKDVTLTSTSGSIFTITQQGTATADNWGRHLRVEGTLTLENIILEGCRYTSGSSYNGGVYVNNGTLIMNNGSTIQYCYDKNGGGVYLKDSNFTMSDGTIVANTAAEHGGGMYINNCSFRMNSGGISDNAALTSGGGVYVATNTKVEMFGGEISYNTAADIAGGVLVGFGSEFHMVDGAISGNIAETYGGGVYVLANSTDNSSFIMDGGEISSNSANTGGGVYLKVSNSTFTLNEGKISGNNAKTNGGGVFVDYFGTFTMYNTTSTISRNTATANGGGVYVNNATFSMSGGTIGGSNASDANTAKNGGGVFVSSSGTFTMDNTTSTISSNTTTTGNGGGVYIYNGTYTMTDGIISKNEATNGGGVYALAGTISITNGEISENTATNGNGGGIYSGANFTMSGVSLSENLALDSTGTTGKGLGGGVYVPKTVTLTVKDTSSITENKAYGYDIDGGTGGGIYTENYNYADPAIVTTFYTNILIAADTTFSGNWAPKAYKSPSDATSSTCVLAHSSNSTSYASTINNYDINYRNETGSITIEKRGNNNALLEGATFLLEVENSSSTTGWSVVESQTTGFDGKLTFDELPLEATYRITETSAPDGYSVLIDAIEVKLPYAKILNANPNDGWDSYEDNLDGTTTYYYYNLTFKVTDVAAIDLPKAGNSNVLPIVFVLFGAGIATASAGVFIFNKKRNSKNRA